MVFHVTKKRFRTRKLRGPPSTSLLYGVGKDILESPDPGTMFKAWAKEYNGVYEIPIILSQKRIALCDAKTLAHVFSKDTWTYVSPPARRSGIARVACCILIFFVVLPSLHL
ncbi:hypothetical protein J3A83DRAFT_4285672 [Scleroderma citrinum]